MKKAITLILAALMLAMVLAGCGKNSNATNTPTPTGENNMVAISADNKEKQHLVIYHISDDEIELHFTSKKLDTNELIAFLAPKDGENGVYNSSANLKLERVDGEIHPFLMVFNEAMDVEFTVDVYDGEMEASVEGDTLICHIKHENIITPFAKSALWHIDTAQPIPFEGIITDDVSTIMETVVDGVLPAEFKRSEYDNQYFKPDTDDFIVVTYDISVKLAKPEWHRPYDGDLAFGVIGDEYDESSVKVTYLLSFSGEKYLGTKVRLEYASIEDAMLAGLEWGFNFVPAEIGMPDEKVEDEKLIAEFFEACDKRLFGAQVDETDYDGIYQGHFDQFRYFDFKALDTLTEVKRLVDMHLSDNSDAIPFVPISSINYTAGKAEKTTLINYGGNCKATSYSSKRTNKAGSNDDVLDMILNLPGDTKNFTPITDDYAYVIEQDIRGDEASEYYGIEGVYEQFLYLYSFDENGNVVQWMYRLYHIDHLNDDFEGYEFPESFKKWTFDKESGAYYIDYLVENEGSQTKDELLTDLVRYGQHEGFYFSKP